MGARTRPPYPPAFRAEAVQLVHANGRSLGQVAKDQGVHHETLRGWVKQEAIDGGRRDGLTTEERTELARLRRENRILKEEREILRKAAAFFAAESATRWGLSHKPRRQRRGAAEGVVDRLSHAQAAAWSPVTSRQVVKRVCSSWWYAGAGRRWRRGRK